MKIGCAAKLTEYDNICRAGFDYVELPCKELCAMDETAFARVERQIHMGPLPALAMNLYCPPELVIAGPGACAKKAREYAATAARRGGALGVRFVGIGSPLSRILPKGFSRETALVQLREFLLVTAGEFSRYGITLCLEALGPCYCNFINHIQEAAAVIESLGPSPVKLVADFYNMEQSGEGDLDLEPYLPLLAHTHISDDRGTPRQRSPLLPIRAGLHRSRVKKLLQSGYTGALSLEVDVPVPVPEGVSTIQILRGA